MGEDSGKEREGVCERGREVRGRIRMVSKVC